MEYNTSIYTLILDPTYEEITVSGGQRVHRVDNNNINNNSNSGDSQYDETVLMVIRTMLLEYNDTIGKNI
jgi:hypothetical protein